MRSVGTEWRWMSAGLSLTHGRRRLLSWLDNTMGHQKVFADGDTDLIEFSLKIVNVLVHSLFNDIFDAGVVHVRTQPAEQVVPKDCRTFPGDCR